MATYPYPLQSYHQPNMRGPSDPNSFRSLYQESESVGTPYESSSSFHQSNNNSNNFFALGGESDYNGGNSPHFSPMLPSPRFRGGPSSPDLGGDGHQAHRREEFAAHGRAAVGARYFHGHESINDGHGLFHGGDGHGWPVGGDMSLHALNMGDEDMFMRPPPPAPQPQSLLFSSPEARNGAHHGMPHPSQSRGYEVGVATLRNYETIFDVAAQGTYQPPYPARTRPPPRAQSTAPSSRSHSPPERPPPQQPQPTVFAQDFVHMNDAFISTDLPEDSPFALVPADRRESFPGHPYPDGHQWPQTFKITEVKQIGPKKQTLACFFCRSRKIACAPRALDETEDRACEQCERRGFDCVYPKESKRGQHNRIRSPAGTPKAS
ncbi:hypothetical protein C8R46DRAFT_1032912 [Mycena filopes]|nr:hypothetical protein C8R46DRAFT_1032912 [Mycena filopes]